MKILLFGKDGQLGRELQRTLLPLGQLVALGRKHADFTRPDTVAKAVAHHRPDVIINPAAYTAVDAAESDADTAHLVNADAVGALAHGAAASGALLVHYSTDYVFDGQKPTPYTEDDETHPLGVYGRTKRDGELAIEASGCNALVFRTSWVYSAHSNNFIRTIQRLAMQRQELSIVADQHGAPTSAELLADVTALAIAAHRRDALPNGLYHLTAAGSTSWYGLAHYVVEAMQRYGVDAALKPEGLRAIPTSEYPTPAARPANSCLNTDKITQALGLHLPDWTVHVDRTLQQLFDPDFSKGK